MFRRMGIPEGDPRVSLVRKALAVSAGSRKLGPIVPLLVAAVVIGAIIWLVVQVLP